MRIGHGVARALFWTLVFCLSVLGGGLWYAYTYITDSVNASRTIRQYAVKFLPTSELDPGTVHVARLFNEVTVRKARIFQSIRGVRFQTLHIPWMSIKVNTRKLIHGELDMVEIDVVQPTLRLCQREDGTWNLDGLLADPWPGPRLEKAPPIVIQDGTLELECPEAEAEGPNPGPRIATILNKVNLRIEQQEPGGGLFTFEGSADGDSFDRLQIRGTVDVDTGRATLDGSLTELTLSDSLWDRVPAEGQPVLETIGLDGGVIDLDRVRVSYDPQAPPERRLHYAINARLQDGVWKCEKLPFPVNDLSATISVEDSMLILHRAEGYNGVTTLRARGRVGLDALQHPPMDLHLELNNFALDQARLRPRTPAEYDELWDVFKPSGMINADIDLARAVAGGPVDVGAKVTCLDVAANYRWFPYPLDHLNGTLTLRKNRLTVNVGTISVGGRPLRLKGTIDNPGPDAIVRLDIKADAVPIDDTLRNALQPDVRKVVDDFRPSGIVRGHADVYREPMAGRPEGLIAINAEIDLTERCEITWAGLPYTVRNLTGRLEMHPDHWIFKNMHGRNGQAEIFASGEVHKLDGKLPNGEDKLKVHVDLNARNLPFSQEMRAALPEEWQTTWRTINPSGASDIEATVDVDPDRGPDRTHIVIDPRPESTVKLLVPRSPRPDRPEPVGPIELRMDDVHGRFIFDDGVVTMKDVSVLFGSAPVRCESGTVVLKNTGQFDLAIKNLWIKGLRLDSELRKKMPPLMRQFARRLDDGRTFTAKGDLWIGWSGKADETAWCRWDHVLVVLNDNKINTGIPLEHIQGELREVRGWSNGLRLDVDGRINLDSVVVLGQQITQVESLFVVKKGVAKLTTLSARFLGGALWGQGWITLDTTPSYWVTMTLHNARFEEYARTVGGRRSYRGDINARIECSGLGSDLRTLQGSGEAHLNDGDLGELPVYFRPVAFVNRTINKNVPRERIKTAFDTVDLAFTIKHGLWDIDPIKFTGNAFSLQGQGTLDPQSNVDLRLEPLLGRDRFHIPTFSDVSREASAGILRVRVTGTLAHPDFSVEPLPVLQLNANRAGRLGASNTRVR